MTRESAASTQGDGARNGRRHDRGPGESIHRGALSSTPAGQDSLWARTLVLWHLLSLDAPTVAVVWTLFIALSTRTLVPMATPVAMGLAVWTLYAADRLLDSRDARRGDLEARHLFHQLHRRAFVGGIAVCTGILAFLLPMLPPAAIHLYLTEGAFMAGYFVLIHVAPEHEGVYPRRWISKELLVGPFFAAATFIPTVSRHPESRSALFPLALLFGALCSLNCLYIYAWEHPTSDRAAWATAYAVRRLSWINAGFLVAACMVEIALGHGAGWTPLLLFPFACAASGVMLASVHRFRGRFPVLTLRAMADAALLTPLVMLPFMGRV